MNITLAGLFEAQEQHLTVSNKRFSAMIEWAIDAVSMIDDSEAPLYIARMQQS